jgi:signal transduction histidine kinase
VQRGDRIHIAVRDQGIGFDSARIEENQFGLAGIRERARLLGGTATVESAPGKGTQIAVELPVIVAN